MMSETHTIRSIAFNGLQHLASARVAVHTAEARETIIQRTATPSEVRERDYACILADMARGEEDVIEKRRQSKRVVKELRGHQQEVEEDKAEALDCRSDALLNHFKKAETNFGKSQTVDHALIDAQIFHRLGEYSKRQAEQLQTGLRTFDVKTFTDNLLVHMHRARRNLGEDDESRQEPLSINFTDLGKSVWKRYKTIPGMTFLYGNAPRADDVAVGLERKKPKRIKKGKHAVKPNELRTEEMEQTETDRQVAEMKRLLKSRGSWNYWELVLDPDEETGFTRSIENIFHSSFLIKENVAVLDMKTAPETIRYRDPNEENMPSGADNGGGGERRSAQVIIGFDRNMWLEKVREHKIGKCMLPSKPVSRQLDEQQRRLLALEDDDEENETAGF